MDLDDIDRRAASATAFLGMLATAEGKPATVTWHPRYRPLLGHKARLNHVRSERTVRVGGSACG